MTQEKQSNTSFIWLMAILMSFTAMAVDSILPALGQMGADLKLNDPNHVQYFISAIFLGMSIGLLIFGPISDSFGRKPAIYFGLSIFMLGCLVSILAKNFEQMIIGRILQGFGGAANRVITIAMIKDQFEGNFMAKVMSLIMMVFILVPALAPSLGQVILMLGHWSMIFIFMFVMGVICFLWLYFGQEETLKPNLRRPFTMHSIGSGMVETIKNPMARNYTLAAGLIFGAFVTYLSTSQQVLQDQYQLGPYFSLAFGFLALSIGMASFVNSRLVEEYGMEKLCLTALKAIIIFGLLFIPLNLYNSGHPHFILFMIYLVGTFFCLGILFGNLNTLAIQPLGHIAGVANSVIGSIQTLVSVSLAAFIGSFYENSVLPLNLGFLVCSSLALMFFKLASIQKNNQ